MRGVSRRQFLAVAGAAAATATVPRAAQSQAQPLNLLFLMTDQQHHGVLGCAGNPIVRTPQLDRVAAQGVRFTHATCPVPYCSPTRAGIVTGRYPSALGIWRNIRATDDPLRLREPCRTFFHQLAARGYRCHHLGKWHLGRQRELRCFGEGREDEEAPRRLLQQRRREAGQAIYDAGPRQGEELVGQVFMSRHTAACHRVWRNDPRRTRQDLSIIGRSRIKPEFHYESVLADYCIGLLRRHRGEPFAITYSVSPPHALWVAPAPYYDQYDPARFQLPANWGNTPERWSRTQAVRLARLFGEQGVREYLRCYYAQVTMMDWCFGRILAELERLGLAERTLVIFTSDHGDMQGGHGMMDKTVGNFYEEIVRVPLLTRLPGVIRPGATSDVLASSIDLAPTILDYLGLEALGDIHGRSLRPFISGRPDDGRPAFAERGRPGSPGCVRMIRTHHWKLSVHGSGFRELYHLREDPGETRNLAGHRAHAATEADLARRLRQHMEQIRDPALRSLFRQS